MADTDREAARYFWEQADTARRNGDHSYAERMEARAGQWANGEVA